MGRVDLGDERLNQMDRRSHEVYTGAKFRFYCSGIFITTPESARTPVFSFLFFVFGFIPRKLIDQ